MADEVEEGTFLIQAENFVDLQTCLRFIEQLINTTQDINVITTDGETPIHIAVKFGHLPIVDSLLKYNANINAQISNPTDNPDLEVNLDTALHLAVRYNRKEIFDYLLMQGADPNIQNIFGQTPLHLASAMNLLSYVQSLLNYNVDVNARCAQNETALHYAVKSQSLEICALLLNHNAYSDAKNINEETPLTYAINLFGEVPFVDNLLNLYSMRDYKFQFDDSVLKTAILCKCVYFVNVLLRKGAKLTNEEDLEPPLFTAIKIGSLEIVDLLLKYLKQGHLKFKNKNTPLHVAAMFGHANLVRYFINLKCNINAKNDHGETPLHLAAWSSSDRHYNLLNKDEQITISKAWTKSLDGKCTVKDCTSCSMYCTCCEYCCLKNLLDQKCINEADVYNPYEEIVDILLDNKAKVNFRTKAGLLPIHVAADRNENFLIVDKLLKAKAYLNGRDIMNHTPIYIAASNNCHKIVEVLLNHSVNIHYRYDDNLDTILHLTCQNGYLHISHMLIRKLNDTSARNIFGNTALHLAILNKFITVTKMLLKYRKNIQVNFENKIGQTPLDLLLHNYLNYDVNILEKFVVILIKNEASPERKNQNNQTLLHIAIEKNMQSKYFDDFAKKVNIDIQDTNGCTSLHLVAQKQALYSYGYSIQNCIQGNNFIECRNYLISLLQEGANINIKDNNDNTAFEIFYGLLVKNEKLENIDHMLPVIQIFFEYIKKWEMLGYHIDKNNLECFNLLDNILSEYNCLKFLDSMKVYENNLILEINKMKEMTFGKNFKIFNILHMDYNKLAGSNVEELLQDNVTLKKLNQEFPLYINMINLQIKRATVRHLKKQNAKVSLRLLIKIDLPLICYEEIFKYLSNDDLNNLKNAQLIYTNDFISRRNFKHHKSISTNDSSVKESKEEPQLKRQKIEE